MLSDLAFCIFVVYENKKYYILIALLVILDQVVKLIIYNSFMDVDCEIIPKVLEFKPVFNSKYS